MRRELGQAYTVGSAHPTVTVLFNRRGAEGAEIRKKDFAYHLGLLYQGINETRIRSSIYRGNAHPTVTIPYSSVSGNKLAQRSRNFER